MIGSVKGTLISRKPGNLLIDINGVGYLVQVSLHNLSLLPEEGSEVFLYIYTHVRDDAIQLFGFSSESEKNMFVALLGVSGIGPKMALNILSGIPHDELHASIEREDVEMLCRIPGLGKKTAHRLILELREKLPSSTDIKDRLFEDALSALINLGYKRNVAQQSVEKVYKQGFDDIELLLREALKQLTGK